MNELRKFIRLIIERSEMGDYAWPDDRGEEYLPREPNTEIENSIRKDLRRHFQNDYDVLNPVTKRYLKKVLKNWYI